MWHPPNNVTENPALRNRGPVFRNRSDAGKQLSDLLSEWRNSDAIVCAIPAGGVPVAVEVSRSLALPLDVLVVSKMTLPWNTEAGFGAMAADGTALINEELVKATGLDPVAMDRRTELTRTKVTAREKHYHQLIPTIEMTGKDVILVDDGLASGFTLRVAIASARARNVASVIVAVPTGHSTSVEHVAQECDRLYCANVREGMRFAVADAYETWADVSEEKVIDLLEKQP
jgi:putative phosphoribosyl transferase